MSNPRLASHAARPRGLRFLDQVRGALAPIGKALRRDPLATFLLAASLVLIVVFFSLLGSLGPEGRGREVPLSTVTRLGEAQRLRTAEMLDYDHQVEVETDGGLLLYSDYPSSDAATQPLFAELSKGGTKVLVNPQSGKSERVIVIQFLVPILILVCLFSFFMRTAAGDGSGGIGAFSAFGELGDRRERHAAAVGFGAERAEQAEEDDDQDDRDGEQEGRDRVAPQHFPDRRQGRPQALAQVRFLFGCEAGIRQGLRAFEAGRAHPFGSGVR